MSLGGPGRLVEVAVARVPPAARFVRRTLNQKMWYLYHFLFISNCFDLQILKWARALTHDFCTNFISWKRLYIVTVTIFKEYCIVTVTIFKKYLIVNLSAAPKVSIG